MQIYLTSDKGEIDIMLEYIFDLVVVALLIVSLTATLGVILNSIGEKIFGGKTRSEFVIQSEKIQVGWKAVGGIKK